MTPDPTKGDPLLLIKKLSNRVDQMKAHLKKVSIASKSPLSANYSKATGSATGKHKPIATIKLGGSSGSNETSPRQQVWDYAAPPLTTPVTIDSLIEKSGEIAVDNSPPHSPTAFSINLSGD